jgi:hypothetical protein
MFAARADRPISRYQWQTKPQSSRNKPDARDFCHSNGRRPQDWPLAPELGLLAMLVTEQIPRLLLPTR